MEIQDLQGKVIPIKDIDACLAMVTEFMDYTHDDNELSLQRLEAQRQAYWNDIYQKLSALKSNQLNPES